MGTQGGFQKAGIAKRGCWEDTIWPERQKMCVIFPQFISPNMGTRLPLLLKKDSRQKPCKAQKESQECGNDRHITIQTLWLPRKRKNKINLWLVEIRWLACFKVVHELTISANHSSLVFIIGTFYKMNSVTSAGSISPSPTSSCKYSLIIFCLGSHLPFSTLLLHEYEQQHYQKVPTEQNTKAT